MVAHGIEMGREHPGIDLIYGEPVCNHPFSQKLVTKQGTVTRALEVSLMPAQAYAKEKSARGRVSTLVDFITLKPRPCTVYVPASYDELFSFCYRDMDDERRFEPSRGEPEAEKTRMSIQVFNFAQVARVAVPEPGREFETRIRSEEERLVQNGIRVIQVWLNTGLPGWTGPLTS